MVDSKLAKPSPGADCQLYELYGGREAEHGHVPTALYHSAKACSRSVLMREILKMPMSPCRRALVIFLNRTTKADQSGFLFDR